MSFLSEYLEKRKLIRESEDAEKDAEEASPEKLLEALAANTEHTSDLIGQRSNDAKEQSKAVLDSLDVVATSVAGLAPKKTDAVKIHDPFAEDTLRVGKITNKSLADINDTLKELLEKNAKIEKYLRPEIHPKDNTSEKVKALEANRKEKDKDANLGGNGGIGEVLGGLLAAGAGWIWNKIRGKKSDGSVKAPEETPPYDKIPSSKPEPVGEPVKGKFGRFIESTKTTLGSIGTKTSETLAKVAPKTHAFAVRTMSAVGDVATKAVEAVKPAVAKITDVAKPLVEKARTAVSAEFAGYRDSVKAVDVTKSIGTKALGYVDSAVESAKPVVSNIVDTSKTVASKSVEYASRAKEALTPVARSTVETGSKALSAVKNAGSSILETLGLGAKAAPALPTASAPAVVEGSTLANAATTAEAVGKPGLLRSSAKLLGRMATPLAVGMTAADAYATEQDTSLTRDEKNVKHAGSVGGLAGSIAGATTGALVGAAMGSVVPVAGTAVGGLLGGLGGLVGGGVGYFGGSKIGKTVMGGVQSARDAVPEGFTDAIGASVALAMSPFSKDAADALETNFVPDLMRVGATFQDSAQSLGNSVGKIGTTFTTALTMLGDKLSDAWDSTKKTVVQIRDTAKAKVGEAIQGAGTLAGQAGTGANTVAQSAASGIERWTRGTMLEGAGQTVAKNVRSLGSGAAQAGQSVAMSAGNVGYNLQKGSSSALDLAQGFQGKTSIAGLTDSQTKAYAGDVMKTESGGKLGITNPYGYVGQYQFGADALADQGLIDPDKLSAAKAAAKASGQAWYKPGHQGAHEAFMNDPSNWKIQGGKDAFLADKQLQDDTFVKYTNANITAGYKSGALTKDSTPADIAGYAKASHLVGTGRANKLVKNGVDSVDANGTSASRYEKEGAAAVTTLASQLDKVNAGKTTVAKSDVPATPQTTTPTTKPTVAKADVTVVPASTTSTAQSPTVTAKSPSITPATAPAPIAASVAPALKKEPVVGSVPTGKIAPEVLAATDVASVPAAKPIETVSLSKTPEMSMETNTFSPDVEQPSVAPVAPTQPSQVYAKQSPLPTLAANVQEETTPVTVANSADMKPSIANDQSRPSTPALSNAFDTAIPKIDNIPLQITDLGLILLNIGHV